MASERQFTCRDDAALGHSPQRYSEYDEPEDEA